MRKSYFKVKISENIDSASLDELIEISRTNFSSCGFEDFSLSESEVDEILGTDAFCGGDLPENLIEKLEDMADKQHVFYFSEVDSAKNASAFKNYLINESGISSVELEELEEQDWNAQWKKFYTPIVFDDLVISPVWENIEILNKLTVLINPGMGFGTGTHETTKLCLSLFLELKNEGNSFSSCLDLGCGSGILGISYLKFYSNSVDFVDIDDKSLLNCEDNIGLNFKEESVLTNLILRNDYQLRKVYDLVFANILEHVLIEEIELITKSVKKDGFLILSGILREQKSNILSHYCDKFELFKERSLHDWTALVLRKK